MVVVGPIFDNSSLTFDSSDMMQPLLEGISDQEKTTNSRSLQSVMGLCRGIFWFQRTKGIFVLGVPTVSVSGVKLLPGSQADH